MEASDGEEGIQRIGERPIDVVLMDIDMPRRTGVETLRWIREQSQCDHVKILMMSGGHSPDEMAEMLARGADDYLAKPVARQQLVARVKAALVHKAAQDRAESLNQQLLIINDELEKTLSVRQRDLVQARHAVVFALASLVEARSRETGAHLTRISLYADALARQARAHARFASVIDEPFVKTLEACALLHDIGKVALPDHVLRPSGPLEPADVLLLQAHTTIGADTLRSVAQHDPEAAGFWQMAIDVTCHHHEHFDGSGYPDGRRGDDIPLAARMVAIADAYDALRSPTISGTALAHPAAVEVIAAGSHSRFDPLLIQAFRQGHATWDEIFHAHPDPENGL
jgi:putative two-component system response regulator